LGGYLFLAIFKKYISSPNFWATFYYTLKKDWEIFLAIFSQTHLVTLLLLQNHKKIEIEYQKSDLVGTRLNYPFFGQRHLVPLIFLGPPFFMIILMIMMSPTS
jgi:hypothetical protein